MLGIISKFNAYINKDIGSDNESNKISVTIRLLCLIIMVYFIVRMIIDVAFGIGILAMCDFVTFGVSICGFLASYHISKNALTWMFVVLTSVWGIVNIWMCGMESSAQNFILLVIILYYFSSYGRYWFKALFSLVYFCFYMLMGRLFAANDPYLTFTGMQNSVYHTICMAMMIVCISTVAYVFSKDSQTLENKLIEYNHKLEEKASTDPLTSLYNRGKALELLEKLVKKSDVNTFSLSICDIDFFKRVNDNFGHDIGDEVLKGIAAILSKATKNKGFVARWGGEEFLIVFPEMNGDDACASLYNIQNDVRKMVVMAGDKEVKVTMTFGLTEYDASLGIDKNIKEADNKLYSGKESGRDKIVY